jgi:peptide/nickel transport system permease protein
MGTKDSTSTIAGIELPDVVRRMLSNQKIVTSLAILLPIVVVVALGETITPYDPTQTHVVDRFAGPSDKYPLGTDHLGRDLLSRVIVGGQSSLILGFGAAGLSLLVGVPIGLTAGFLKGRVDEVLMRLMDIMISIPSLILGILILVSLSSSLTNVIIAVGFVYIPRVARVTRSATLSVSEEPFVLAAKARGDSTPRILFREILPNVSAPIIVEGSIRVGYGILTGTGLSFLGLGTGPPHPDWGFMIAQARVHIYQSPWMLLWPGLTLVATIVAMNMLGDGLRDVLDPRTFEEGEL